ncbi:MAG: hypothetical protein P8H13_10275 [Polaribacter sp.]|nr:hypothetical protein [Polaribacter sp.]MDG1812307.1 hypothetical protein [Polaribacter sp.]MDG1993585.1 hypothetical protein [Polaribacter sp.]
MYKKAVFLFFLVVFTSCQFFEFGQQKTLVENPIASVNDSYLYRKDIATLIPKNISKSDSILITKGIINNWAVKELLQQKAVENLTQTENTTYLKLVEDYKESLYVNGYKARLIQQQLDTVVSEEEITEYYILNSNNFRLNEELIKIKYVHFGNDLIDQEIVVRHFKSEGYDDLIALENQEINFKASNLNDSTWIKLTDVLLKIPKFKEEPRDYLLKKSKFIQKEDSLGLYLVAVKDVLKRNDIAPKNYISPTIKQLILHKRKLELIRDIEKTLLNDAIQNKNFKEY